MNENAVKLLESVKKKIAEKTELKPTEKFVIELDNKSVSITKKIKSFWG